MGHQSILSADSRIKVTKTVTFDGSAGGGESGTPVPVFEITGRVLEKDVAIFCTESLQTVGGNDSISLQVGDAGSLFLLSSEPEDVDTGDWVVHTGGGQGDGVPLNPYEHALSDDVVFLISSGAIVSGELVVTMWYEPITEDGALTPA